MKFIMSISLMVSLFSLSIHAEIQQTSSCGELSGEGDQYFIDDNKSQKPINYCNEDIYHSGSRRLSAQEKKDKEDRVKHYRKECKKKAKAYKRAVAKDLLKKFKLKQAFQAITKRKKKLIKKNGVTNGRSKKNQIELSSMITDEERELLENGDLSKEEFSEMVMNKVRKEMPNIDELVKQSKEKHSFKKGFDEKEVYPVNLVIKSDGGESCILKSDKFPEEEEFDPKECEFCKPETVQNNFTNDCAYMVSDDFSEQDARELVGATKVEDIDPFTNKKTKEDSHCNHDMKNIKNDMSQINNTVKKLCSIAKSGYTPHFNIESTRNEYTDKTNNLAQKRGEFTQKYIYKQLKENSKYCDLSELDELPAWLETEEEFNKHITASAPEYKRPNGEVGTYGPKPDAQGTEIENEKKYLALTLASEAKELSSDLVKSKKRIAEIDLNLKEIDGDISSKKLIFNQTNESVIKGTLVDGLKEKTQNLTDLSREALELYNKKKELKQERLNLETKISGLESELGSERFAKGPDNSFNLVKKLDQFYKGDRTNRAKWDKELFNQFKMARISGEISKENEFGLTEDMMTPELSAMLKTLVQVDNFTCELKPFKTTRMSLEGALKTPLKIVTAITLPVGAVIGTIGGGINVACQGCLTPGKVPPRFRIDLSKRGFKNAWENMKDATETYVTWDGALEVNKYKYSTLHKLSDYSSKKYGQSETSNEGCINSQASVEKASGSQSSSTQELSVTKE